MVRHYDLDQVLVMVLGIPVTEFADGDSVKVTFAEDDWVVTQGHHGSVIRSKKPNSVAELTLTLMQGSPANQLLSLAAKSDLLTGLGVGQSSITDTNGTSYAAAPYCWLKKRPDLNLSTEPGSTEWVFTMANADISVGENRLA